MIAQRTKVEFLRKYDSSFLITRLRDGLGIAIVLEEYPF